MNAVTDPNKQQPPEDLRLTDTVDGGVRVDGLTDDLDESGVAPAPVPTPAPAASDAPAHSELDDEDDDPAVRSAEEASMTEAQLEARREKRRKERKDKRERLQQRFATLEAQILARDEVIDGLQRQLNGLGQRGIEADRATLAQRIRQAQDNIAYLESVIEDGTKSQNGAAVAKATTALGETQLQLRQLRSYAQRMEQAASRPAQEELDPRAKPLGMQWLMDNSSWYDPRSNDPISVATRAVDNQLVSEGFDPRSPVYWEELTRRTQPLRARVEASRSNAPPPPPADSGYNAGASQGKPRSPVAPGSSGDGLSVASGGGGQAQKSFVLSPDRVQALKDAGIWDDPTKRADAIRRFRQYDAQSR